MRPEELCVGCMAGRSGEQVCPHCGWFEGAGPESPLHLPPRTVLQGKYMLGRVLGQGGFGITYLAWDLFLERALAVKEYFPREMVYRDYGSATVSVIRTGAGQGYQFGLQRFLDEAKLLARFDGHPNIVSVKDFFRENETAYLVMNYLQGVTLKNYLHQGSASLSPGQAIAIIYPVLDALEAVHGASMLHRDISPDNIYLTSSNQVVLIDFGAARQSVSEQNRNLSIILKPGYAPEEQYRSSGEQGPWTDIYAVAATLYEAVTGTMPPDAMDRLVSDILVPPSELGVDIDRELEEVVLKALAVKARDRYQSVKDFSMALHQALDRSSFSPDRRIPQDPAALDFDEQAQPAPHQERPPATVAFDQQNSGSPVNQRSDEAVYSSGSQGNVEADRAQATDKVVSIGRHPTNDLILGDEIVSRYHAELICRSGTWLLQDKGSTHGTFVDSRRIDQQVTLTAGDRVRIGSFDLYFDGSNLVDSSGRAQWKAGSGDYTGLGSFDHSAPGEKIVYDNSRNRFLLPAVIGSLFLLVLSIILILLAI